MARRLIECAVYECDVCGKEYENGDGVIMHYPANDTRNIDGPTSFDDWTSWKEYVWCDSCSPPCECEHYFGEHEYGDDDCQEEGCACSEFRWQPKAEAR